MTRITKKCAVVCLVYNTVNKFEQLIPEVMKVLDNAENEVYFATRYHDPHVSNFWFFKGSPR